MEGGAVAVVRNELPLNTGHCLIKGVAAEEMGKRLALAQTVKDFVLATDVPDYVND